MRANRARWPIATMARLLRVSTSGYYAWLMREPSRRACRDAQLLARIRTLHASSRGTYGAPRIHAQLKREGEHVGRKRVARLMRLAGLCGVSRRQWNARRAHAREPGELLIWCVATSVPQRRTCCGRQTPPTFQAARDFCIWPSCLMCSAGVS